MVNVYIKEVEGGSIVILEDKQTGQRIEILGYIGCAIADLQLQTKTCKLLQIIEGYPEGTDIQDRIRETYRGAALFPFPNRLAGGTYTFENHQYTLHANDGGGRQNALHGLAYDKPFHLMGTEEHEEFATATFSFRTDGSHPGYPFKMLLSVSHTLSCKDGYACKMTVTNEGANAAPFGVGYHPYYKISSRAEVMLKLPPAERYGLDERMIPDGSLISFDNHASFHAFTDLFDDGFKLTQNGGRAEVSIVDSANEATLLIWQNCDPAGMNYLQIYTPPEDQTLAAVEAMSCAADAFNNGDGLQILAPGNTAEFNWGVLLQ